MSSPSIAYNLGDYIYCENSPTEPYKIRRIEELVKNPDGVEAEVTCFYRRRDIPARLLSAFDELQGLQKTETAENDESSVFIGQKPTEVGFSSLPSHQKQSLKDRELFSSGQIELVSESDIRGKCTVALLKEDASCSECLNYSDTFYYSWAFDPVRQTLKKVEEKTIRIGDEFQCEVPDTTFPEISNSEDFETLVWSPHNGIPDHQVDQFLVLARSVGTYARAIECLRPGIETSLTMNAAAASRDATLQNALNILHKHRYDMSAAWKALVPSCEPVLFRDELEGWCSAEAALFEEAILKYSKDFVQIRQDFLPWKTVKNVVEYYYMWKTSDHYVKQKKVNTGQAESKLIQVLISSRYDVAIGSPASNLVTANSGDRNVDKSCSMCGTSVSSYWMALENANAGRQLCCDCQDYWKRYSGKLTTSPVDRTVEPNNRQKEYRCLTCRKGFNRAVKLATHVQSHKAACTNLPEVLDLSRDAVPTRWGQVKVVIRKLSSEQIENLINRKSKNIDTMLGINKGINRRRIGQVDSVPGMIHKRNQNERKTRQPSKLEHTFEESQHREICIRKGLTLKNNNTKNINLNSLKLKEASVLVRRLSSEEIQPLMHKKPKILNTDLKTHEGKSSGKDTDSESKKGFFLKRTQRREMPLTCQTTRLTFAVEPTQNCDIETNEGLSQTTKHTKELFSNHHVRLTSQLSPVSHAEPIPLSNIVYDPAIGIPPSQPLCITNHANLYSSRRCLQVHNQGFSSLGHCQASRR